MDLVIISFTLYEKINYIVKILLSPNVDIGENKILRLGPYSPMLNPIERVWSVIKAEVKRVKVLFTDVFNENDMNF